MKTLQEIIQNNNWTSIRLERGTAVNRLFNSGIITRATEAAKQILNGLDAENVPSTLTIGIIDIEWAEQNLGDASDSLATSLEPLFDEVNVKTFYGNQWWAIRTIQKDLLGASSPEAVVGEKVSAFWATMWNRIISATISGMADIVAITEGDGTANFSRSMVTAARKKKGDMGVGKLADMYMSSTTLFDIIDKQDSGTIQSQLITEKYGTVTIIKDGVQQVVQSDTPEYVYNGVTKIHVDDTMKDGIISMVENGAFAFEQKNLNDPIMYDKTGKAGNGSGKEEFGTKSLYILHPVGFSFKGVLGTDYSKKSGLTLAELQGGGLYELKVSPKLSPITNLKVKIGA